MQHPAQWMKNCFIMKSLRSKIMNWGQNSEKTVDEKGRPSPTCPHPQTRNPTGKINSITKSANLIRRWSNSGADVLFVTKPDENSNQKPQVTVSDYILGELLIDQPDIQERTSWKKSDRNTYNTRREKISTPNDFSMTKFRSWSQQTGRRPDFEKYVSE